MEKQCFPAHIRNEGEPIVQTVRQHCEKTAEYTADALHAVGLEKTGYLLGLVHDCGKLTGKFSDYIQRAASGEAVRRGSVNHTFAAVKLILSRFHVDGDIYRKLVSEMIAYALGAHHGLFDCVGPDHRNGFAHRLAAENELYTEASENYFRQCCSLAELEEYFDDAYVELKPFLIHFTEMSRRDDSGGELCYYFGCLTRLLLSALIDGDRRDTAEFMSGGNLPNNCTGSPVPWQLYLSRVEDRLGTLPGETEIQKVRAVLSQICREQALQPGKIYRLNLPTGAGKTLSSLRYALAHAAMHQKSRIIFISPLLSILEQNAAVIREYLQDDDIILEHHSNIVQTESEQDTISVNELLTESWDSPVIITTLVQLLNTMFSGKTTAIRRFHALCRSVIVIDEVQTLPPKLLSMFQLSISFLAEACDATVVLCSATQPADDYTQHPYFKSPEQLVSYDATIWNTFKRTNLQEAEQCTLDAIPAFVKQVLVHSDSLLIVCNKKDEAAYLFRELCDFGCDCFHLSAAMCSAHREDTLNALYASLADKTTKTVCVSTQVIEAGVDISFGCVIRLTAGMDSVIQSAGRCNRNGESGTTAPVYIIDCTDENLSHLNEIKQAKNATVALLAEYRRNAAAYNFDLSSDQAIRQYYRFLYGGMNATAMDYPAGEYGSLYDLLANNTKYATEYSEDYGQYYLCQSFMTAGKLFSVFDEETDTVLVPYSDGEEIIRQICRLGNRSDPAALRQLRNLTKQAKPYSISVFQYQRERLEKLGAIDRICSGGILILQPDCFGEDHYSNEVGLTI